MRVKQRWISVYLLLITSLLFSACGKKDQETNSQADAPDSQVASIDTLGESTGAAPGYIADEQCASCHQDIAADYRRSGMARSFSRPHSSDLKEARDAPVYFHQASQRYYQMQVEDDVLLFHRYQLNEEGDKVNSYTQQVDWILGSGEHARNYLYHNQAGELFQLPIAWYPQSQSWGMAAGYDKTHHDGIRRGVERDCMFCHNAYPDVPVGADNHWAPQHFPQDLPQGIGCQRCHGPGAAHVQAADSGSDADKISASIVNPASLSRAQQDAVCFQCHLQPATAMMGPRRFNRADYSFRPGELLDDYMLHMEVMETDRDARDRFEINHHAYRMTQSQCYLQGELSCLSCHSPHSGLQQDQRLQQVQQTCLGCHEAHERPQELPQWLAATEADDCVSCHMPKRRTQDVVNVVMTDHKIQRMPPMEDPKAPLTEKRIAVSDLSFLNPAMAPGNVLGEIYRAVAALRASLSPAAANYLGSQLNRVEINTIAPFYDLAIGYIKNKDWDNALIVVNNILDFQPDDPLVMNWKGIILLNLEITDLGFEVLERSAELGSEMPEIQFNHGLMLASFERYGEALPPMEKSLQLRPNNLLGWYWLGNIQRSLGQSDGAINAYEKALSIEPSHTRSYQALAGLLAETGQDEKARQVLATGLRFARDKAPLQTAAPASGDIP